MLRDTSDSREQQLKELENFTNETNQEITDIVRSLGWTMESVSNVVSMIALCLDITKRYYKNILNIICIYRTKNILHVHTTHPID